MIKQLPEEVLLMVFNELESSDLIQCQQVCQAWYSPARITFLNAVNLDSIVAIQRFITCVDLNSKPVYLNAVKKLNIGYLKDSLEIEYSFDRESAEKLLLRFPNLREVRIRATCNSFNAFDETLCELLLESCPNLEAFEVDTSEWELNMSFNVLLKLRSLVTALNVPNFGDATNFATAEEFLVNFPRLKIFFSEYEALNFERLLPVFERLPNFTSINSAITDTTDYEFDETYLEGKSPNEKMQFQQRLANIKDIELFSYIPVCRNSIKVMSKYWTNLNTFSLSGRTGDWDDDYDRLFNSEILELVLSAKNNGYFGATTDAANFSRKFPFIRRRMYQNIPIAYRNTAIKSLVFIIHDYGHPNEEAGFHIESKRWPFTRSVVIRVTNNVLVALDLLLETPITEVNAFTLTISETLCDEYNGEAIIKKYEQVLANMPSLKKLVMDVPSKYKEVELIHYTYDRVYCGLVHPQVEEFTLRAAPDLDIQTMLNRNCFAFPNLKNLALYYFSGVWKAETGDFRVILPKYSLKKLEIDMTPVLAKTIKYLKVQNAMEQHFFVIELETLNNGERRLFKVSLDLASVTCIADDDIKGYIRGIDYFKVLINIHSLQRLELCMEVAAKSSSWRYFTDDSLKPVIKRATVPL